MILLVDDNEDLMTAYELCLRLKGYDAKSCTSGAQALTFFEKGLKADLILLDFAMPEMTGEQFVDELRLKHPHVLSDSQVVGMSCYAADYVGVSRFKTLVHDYVEKPSTIEDFLTIVQRFIKKEEL